MCNDAKTELFWIGAYFLMGILVGVVVAMPVQLSQPQTTTTYTLEDGTVLHDCYFNDMECGMQFRDCSNGQSYKCQKNVKITTGTNEKECHNTDEKPPVVQDYSHCVWRNNNCE